MLRAEARRRRRAARGTCMSIVVRALVLVALVASALGCGVPIHAVPSQLAPNPRGVLLAGASEVDVTPPPGLGTWGHGPDARPSRGHRGRLRCRVVYLEDAPGERVALVPCDFAAIDQHLQRRIGELVVAETGLGADRIVMSATHTHGGPGHYFAETNYSGLFSGRQHGYDPRFVDWLARRIADAILDAARDAKPARIAWFSGEVNRGDGTGATIGQNRSLAAHCENDDPMHGAPSTCRRADVDAAAEVDGRLDLLRIDVEEDGTLRPLALYATFPVHGTAVPNTNVFFEADLWGFAATYVAARLGDRGPFVAALANGAEGDVRPSYSTQGWDEARRLGTLLGERIVAAHAASVDYEENPRIVIAYRDVELPRAAEPDGEGRLCRSGRLGRSAPGGSEEGRTGRYGPRWHEGMTEPPQRGCQAPKGRFFAHRFASLGFPEVAPLQLVGIGPGTLVAHPWEITTAAGRRLRARVAATLSGSGPVALIGLSNQYLQYLTTPEEYAQQHYEGASTLFGPDTLAVVSGHFAELARALRASREGAPPSIHMLSFETTRPVVRRVFSEATQLPPRIDIDVPFLTRFEDHVALVLEFVAGPTSSMRTDGGVLARVERRDASGAWVQASDANGRALDDRHEDLLFEHLHHARREGRRHVAIPYEPEGRTRPRDYHDLYRVLWVPAQGTPAGEYRIVLFGAGVERPGPGVAFEGRP